MEPDLSTIQSLPNWVKAAGSVISAMMFIIGLASLPDNTKRWFRWLRGIGSHARKGVPWWILLSFSLGLLTLLWFPNLWWVWGLLSLALAAVSWKAGHQQLDESKGTAIVHPPLFAGHMALEVAYPIHDQIRRARHVDGLWLSGRAVFQLDDTAIRGTVRRIILPTPDSPLLREMSRWTGIPYGAADLAIQESTDRAIRLDVEVRWLREFPGFTLLLADSGDENGYAHVEILLPFTQPGHRPIQRIERRDAQVIFERLVKMFDRLWEKAVNPAQQTSPLPEEAPPLSRGEREAVRDMRDLWKDCALPASDKMRYLALNVLGTIDGGINWVERLLRPDIDGLEDATNSMDEMFRGSHVTLQDARQKFDVFFAAYATTAGDLYYIDRDHLPLTKPPCTEWYKRWEIANAAFVKGLKSLHNQPEYEHELKLDVIDSGAREFLERRQFSSEVIDDTAHTDSSVLYETQKLFVDIYAAVNGAVWLIENTLARVLAGETKEDVVACMESLEDLTAVLDRSGTGDDVQDAVHALYVSYQRLREWIAESIRRGIDLLDEERAGNWHDADSRFLGTLTRLFVTNLFSRLVDSLSSYSGPNPQFGFYPLPSSPGMTAGKIAFGVLDDPTPSSPDIEAPPDPAPEEERPET